ncbi:MAG: AtpZ/AtpI family protein [Planctomycetaceae bacterium]
MSTRSLSNVVARKRRRRLAARGGPERTIWFGLGMFGLIGWSVAIPTLIGVAVGVAIDYRWQSRYSWTLMLMLLGVALGCLNAWRWVRRESTLEPIPDDDLSDDHEEDASP